jgi:RimJ/RimL family protein N-acetyltransferase
MHPRATVRRPRRSPDIQKLRLPDGARILVRPVREDDAPAFAHAYTRLGLQSLRRRHLNAAFRLTARELRYLTAVDHHEHVAFVAIDPGTGDILGSARYFRLPNGPARAEMAIEVIDDWQRRGVGRLLLQRLSCHAKAHGIDSFTALVAADNLPMQRALKGAIASTQADGAELEYVLYTDALAHRSDTSPDRTFNWARALRIHYRLATIRLRSTHPTKSRSRRRTPVALPTGR